MNELQLSLTRLIGKKELTFGCLYQIPGDSDIYKYVDDEVSILPNGIKMQN